MQLEGLIVFVIHENEYQLQVFGFYPVLFFILKLHMALTCLIA